MIRRKELEESHLAIPMVRNDDAETPSPDLDLRANASTKTGFRSKVFASPTIRQITDLARVINALTTRSYLSMASMGCLC
jgi:hypothetical protein